MAVISLRTGKAVAPQDYHRFKIGDYVFSTWYQKTEADFIERNLLQVRGYDVFGQVMVHYVRHKSRKYVPWHLEMEKHLLPASDFGFYPAEI